MSGVLSTARLCSSIFKGNSVKVSQNAVFKEIAQALRFKSDHADTDDYQYIQKSTLRTDNFQASLPRLPIPKLEDTCARYLKAQKPLLTERSFEKTEAIVKEFQNKEGKSLQKALIKEDKRNKHTSYITKHWFDLYLSDRKPLPINYNPFLVFNEHPEQEHNEQLIRATNLVISSLRFYKSLTEGLLEPEVFHLNPAKSDTALFRQITGFLPKSMSYYGAYLFKAYPLDMSQYNNLFNSTRIPQKGKDWIKHTPGRKHILVMSRGNFYIFDVIDGDGNIVEPDVILSNIDTILKRNDSPAEFPVGVLTTEDRDSWASAREYLEHLGNTRVLDFIDSSLFNLSLDEVVLEDEFVSPVRLFLHSDGTNRWFDKSFSLIVNEDGTSGLNFEHSWGDGVAVLRYFNDIYKDSWKKPRVDPDTVSKGEGNVTKLVFNLDDEAKNFITSARMNYLNTTKSLGVRIISERGFGRSLCKPFNISPDALMQLSFQMAYIKMTGRPVPTYESCSTAAFKHGRTETVRPCTMEVQKFCDVFKSKNMPDVPALQKLLIEISKQHSKLIKEAAMGQGFDRHLLALRLKAEAQGVKCAIFDDPAYAYINHNILSTSTLSSDFIKLGAFGPVVQDGFGIGYSMWQNRMGLIVTNYEKHSNIDEFVYNLNRSIQFLDFILSNKN